jgi:hypothetical protein
MLQRFSAPSALESQEAAELTTTATPAFTRVTPRLCASAVNKEPR